MSPGENKARVLAFMDRFYHQGDDGRGFDPAAVARPAIDGRSGGMGLRSMRERAAAAGLSLEVTSAPGAGTVVRLTGPRA
jgi:signal transduction histidine kinase